MSGAGRTQLLRDLRALPNGLLAELGPELAVTRVDADGAVGLGVDEPEVTDVDEARSSRGSLISTATT